MPLPPNHGPLPVLVTTTAAKSETANPVSTALSRLHDKTTNLTVWGIFSSDSSRQLPVLDHEPVNPFRQLLAKYPGLTRPSFGATIPPHDVAHHIRTTSPPVFFLHRRLAPARLAAAKGAHASDGHHSSVWKFMGLPPPHGPKGTTGDLCPCGDYRALDDVTVPDLYPVPHLQDFANTLFGKSVFSRIDLGIRRANSYIVASKQLSRARYQSPRLVCTSTQLICLEEFITPGSGAIEEMAAELLKTSFTEIVATVCFQVGFERASFEAIDILTDVLHKYLRTLSGFIAALGEDSYFGILDGVTTLEVLDQPLESLLTFADEVGSYMPRPVPTKCLPLYGHDKLRLPPKEQYALTALQLSHLPSAAVTEEKPAVKTPPKPTDLTLPNSALKGTCQQNLPPWAARVSYRLTRVTYDTVTKRLSEHEPPTPIAIDPSSSLIHRRSMRPSTSTFRRSSVATVTPKVGSPTVGAPSPRRAYNSKDAWAAALQAMPSPGAPPTHPQSPRVNSPSIAEKMSPQPSSQVPTPKSSLLTPANKLASSRSVVKRAFRSRKRRPSFGRKRPPSSKRFALSSAWTSGPSSVPPVPEEEEPVAVKVGESVDASGPKPDSRTPAASCHSSSPDNYHQTFGFSPDSSPSDPTYHEEIFHRKEDGSSQPAETTVTPKLPTSSPPLPAQPADKSPVTSPVRPFSPDLSAADRAPSTPHTPTTTPNNAEDRPKLSPPASSSSSLSPLRHQRSETAATPATETKQRPTRATESGTSSVSEQPKTVGGHRPVQSKSSKKKNKKAPFSLPSRGGVTPKRRLPGSKTSIVINKEPLSPLSENDLHSTPSPSACSDSNTEPMTDQERSADFEMPRQKPEPPLGSPERHASPELAKTDRTSSSYQSVPQPPSQATFLSSSGITQPTVLHFPPTKRPRSRTSSSLSSLSSHSSSSSSPSSGSSSVLSSPLRASPGRGISTKPVPPLPPGPPPLSSLTCLPQTPAAVSLGSTPGPPPPCTLSPITNPRTLGSNAPSLAESDDGAKTPPAKQTSPPSSPAARTLSSVSQRGPPSPLSISSLPEPDSRFPRFSGTTTGTAAPLTPASTQPHGSLRIKIRLGADAASCHSSDGPPTETTDMLSRSSVSPFAALRPEAASPLSSSTSSTSPSSSSSSPSSSPSRHSSDEDLDHVARRHAAIPPSLQVIRRRSPPIPSSQHESLTSQSSSVVPPVTKAPKLCCMERMTDRDGSEDSFTVTIDTSAITSDDVYCMPLENNNGEQIWLCPICLSEDDGNLMVGCDSCDDWYHSGCLGLAKEPDAAQWFCPKCSGEPLPPPQPRPPTAALPASSPTHAPASPHHHHHHQHHHHSSATRKPKANTSTGSKRAKIAASARKRGLL
nr:unnamed protein product [Spirometra erinaceieuropaei]